MSCGEKESAFLYKFGYVIVTIQGTVLNMKYVENKIKF